MPTKRPVKPYARKKRASAPAPKRGAADRKTADALLRDSEELYESLFRNNHAVMLIIDPEDGRIVDSNRAAVRFYGYTARKLKTLRIGDINMLDTGDVRLKMNRALKEEQRYFLFRHRLADGTIRDVEVNSGPILLEGRRLLYSIVHDITERKRAEEALRDGEQRYRMLVDNAQFAVVVTSLVTGLVLFVNERAATLFEIPLTEAIGRSVKEHWVRAEDRDRFLEDLSATGRVTEYECALRTANGAVRWVLVSASIIEYEGERAAFVVYNDITQRKRAEEALRDSLETASAMLNAATESFGLIDTGGMVLAANETFARRLGKPLDGIIGTSIYDYLSPALAVHRRERFGEVIKSGQPLRFSDERDGRWLEHSLYPIFDFRGRVSRLVIYTQDITDRRRSEEALRQSEVLLTSIFQAAPVGIGLVYNRILGWTNDQVARMLGYSIEELAEKSARILYESDEEFERVGREKYIEVRQGGTGVIETRWKRKDGAFLDILLSSKAIDPSDISAGVVFTALDITDRKRGEEALQRYQDELEQRVLERTSELMVANQALILEIEDRNRADKALRDSERRLSDIIEFLPDATFVIDRDGKVIAWNQSMETMTGIPAKDMLGKGNYEYAVPFYG